MDTPGSASEPVWVNPINGRDQTMNVRSRQKNCRHMKTITVRSAGSERIVCESCRHVSFRFLAEVSDSAERARFRRELETVNAAG